MKRLFDVFASLMGILLSLPFSLFIALFIVLESKGGVFYKQTRVGQFNRDFTLFKYRTMKKNADKLGLLTTGNDMRVTRVGRVLRKYKLDEIPQFINIFLGDMSFVGTRPEVRKYVDLYNSEQLKVLNAKPGLTDYASIEFINENEILGKSSNPEKTYIEEVMPAKLELNKKYLNDISLSHDIKLIFKTLKKIVTQH